jgi:hypothetical protein
MKNNVTSFSYLLSRYDKYSKLQAFLIVMPHAQTLSNSLLLKLAGRFSVSPDTLALLINIAVNGGTYYEN